MIRKLVRQMLTAQVFSALTVSLCLLIDNIMIGRFLKEEGLAAYSLANPILLIIGGLGTLLAAGIQVACSRSLGKGSQEETNAGYSSALLCTGVVSSLFLIFVLLLRSPLSVALGAGKSGTLFEQTRDYLAGFSIGAPASMGALTLIPFMQMGGQSGLLIAAVLGMTVTDIVLDLLNGLVFHGGMFGMGLASAISYYVAMIIAAFYFLSGKCVFKFSMKNVSMKKIRELFTGGIPAGFNMVSSVILVYVMNRLLKTSGGSAAIAAFAVITTIGNAANCITTGIGGVSLTLSGILFNEEDQTGLGVLMRQLCRSSVILGLSVGVILIVFAPQMVGLFIPDPGDTQKIAILGLRCYAAGLIPCCINNALKNYWQASGRVLLTELVSLVETAVLPILVAMPAATLFGVNGHWIYFVAGEVLTLAALCVMINGKTGRLPWGNDACLLLRPDFGCKPEDLMEKDIHTLEEVTETARQAEAFCLSHGQSAKVSSHIALCIEEMASNTIAHGFTKDKKEHHLSIRIMYKKDRWLLRFRDDCNAFDPVHYVPKDSESALGIRLTLAMAQDAKYTYSLNLNNLMLQLPGETAGQD